MTAFYHMASEIKPGRGLTTKLTTDIPGRLSCYERRRFKCLDPTILPVTYASTFLLSAVAIFSD